MIIWPGASNILSGAFVFEGVVMHKVRDNLKATMSMDSEAGKN